MGVERLWIGFLAVLWLSACGPRRSTVYPTTYEVYWANKTVPKAEPLVYPRLIPDSTRLTMPPRYQEVVLPVWIPDYVTPNGDLVQAHYIYVVVRKSTWYLEGFPLGAEPIIPARP